MSNSNQVSQVKSHLISMSYCHTSIYFLKRIAYYSKNSLYYLITIPYQCPYTSFAEPNHQRVFDTNQADGVEDSHVETLHYCKVCRNVPDRYAQLVPLFVPRWPAMSIRRARRLRLLCGRTPFKVNDFFSYF